jgi:hypothetical protein
MAANDTLLEGYISAVAQAVRDFSGDVKLPCPPPSEKESAGIRDVVLVVTAVCSAERGGDD